MSTPRNLPMIQYCCCSGDQQTPGLGIGLQALERDSRPHGHPNAGEGGTPKELRRAGRARDRMLEGGWADVSAVHRGHSDYTEVSQQKRSRSRGTRTAPYSDLSGTYLVHAISFIISFVFSSEKPFDRSHRTCVMVPSLRGCDKVKKNKSSYCRLQNKLVVEYAAYHAAST